MIATKPNTKLLALCLLKRRGFLLRRLIKEYRCFYSWKDEDTDDGCSDRFRLSLMRLLPWFLIISSAVATDAGKKE